MNSRTSIKHFGGWPIAANVPQTGERTRIRQTYQNPANVPESGERTRIWQTHHT